MTTSEAVDAYESELLDAIDIIEAELGRSLDDDERAAVVDHLLGLSDDELALNGRWQAL